ncbi:MAG: hypothetical protein Q4G26_11620 [Paracoccus sp. (in: a-proteobacteria)]|nr:hypothetical protein [Paracoccus sp. (in: a-proteobacteria)]
MDCHIPTDIDLELWREVPAVIGSVASAGDVEKGCAVFSTGGHSALDWNRGLPALADWHEDGQARQRVVIVQMEVVMNPRTTLVGYVIPGKGFGVGTLPEFDILGYAGDDPASPDARR